MTFPGQVYPQFARSIPQFARSLPEFCCSVALHRWHYIRDTDNGHMAKFLGSLKDELCGICSAKHSPYMPDNRTFVPCCPACWKEIPKHVRLMVLVQARQEDTWASLVSVLNGWLEEKVTDIVREKLDSRQDHDFN
ncbi:MAG: hypothetical protein ABGZ23_25205 [Fuerstiella sp.]